MLLFSENFHKEKEKCMIIYFKDQTVSCIGLSITLTLKNNVEQPYANMVVISRWTEQLNSSNEIELPYGS